jgi:hypothetical protein
MNVNVENKTSYNKWQPAFPDFNPVLISSAFEHFTSYKVKYGGGQKHNSLLVLIK